MTARALNCRWDTTHNASFPRIRRVVQRFFFLRAVTDMRPSFCSWRALRRSVIPCATSHTSSSGSCSFAATSLSIERCRCFFESLLSCLYRRSGGCLSTSHVDSRFWLSCHMFPHKLLAIFADSHNQSLGCECCLTRPCTNDTARLPTTSVDAGRYVPGIASYELCCTCTPPSTGMSAAQVFESPVESLFRTAVSLELLLDGDGAFDAKFGKP